MCGIAGILFTDGTPPGAVPLIERMTSALTHRGPDDCGYHADASALLGHRRLSIIDLETGQQPIYNEDRTIDRKSTRLNSSHTVISYAVFCLKKKKKKQKKIVKTQKHKTNELTELI